MSLATVASRALTALTADGVSVEVHLAQGLPGWSIVGLPEAAVREAKDRVRAAIIQSGYEVPQKRITVNLAPADLPKEGGCFDLAIALGILVASRQVPGDSLAGVEVLGELSLSGDVRPVRGALPAAIGCARARRALLLPPENQAEAALVEGLTLHLASSLAAVAAALHAGALPAAPPLAQGGPAAAALPDLRDIAGQPQARRALEVAAAGGHSLLMSGPPGAGKSMLAARLPGILPPLNREQALAVGAIHSLAGCFDAQNWGNPPFRAPHHTASAAALAGGGQYPRPGEMSLAHFGALFLDELPEWRRDVLETLREPLETGQIRIARASGSAVFPARFQLLAAMNPCPCGYLGDSARPCRCTPEQIARYRGRISGPLLDRIDLHLEVPRLPVGELAAAAVGQGEDSATVRARVMTARQRQQRRQGRLNAWLEAAALKRLAIDGEAQRLLLQAVDRLQLSARAYHRLLRVARSIADLAECEAIAPPHVAEAVRYRQPEAVAA